MKNDLVHSISSHFGALCEVTNLWCGLVGVGDFFLWGNVEIFLDELSAADFRLSRGRVE